MNAVREIREGEVRALLTLYLDLHETSVPEDSPRLQSVWEKIRRDPDHHIIVYEQDGQIVSSCVCVIVSNLTRSLRPYALIENVVTRADCRGKGYATACLDYACDLARQAGCYKAMLLTGAKDTKTLDFYRRAGFDCTEKTAFIRRFEG